ncbi:MAG: hypothetical protein AAB328_12870, partial [candidate division NC10 bacterium]
MTIPETASLFQALTLAFWRFQGLAATTLFTAVLQAIEARARAELEAAHPGRFRHKGSQPRQWQLPFGRMKLPLVKLWDRVGRRTVYPLKEALDLPWRVRWCEETLLPGYRLAVIQSFRKSQKAVRDLAPDGRAPSHHTLHRRFQGFAAHLDPVPALTHRRGPKPSAYQQADGTKLTLQAGGHSLGLTDLRLVVGSRTPHGPLEVLDYSVADSWQAIADRLRQRFPTPPPRSSSATARRGFPTPWQARPPCPSAAWCTPGGACPSRSTGTASRKPARSPSRRRSSGSPACSSARRSSPSWIPPTRPPSRSCWRPRSGRSRPSRA